MAKKAAPLKIAAPASAPTSLPADDARKGIFFRLLPARRTRLRMLSATLDRPIQSLLDEAVDDLFAKHRAP